MKKTLLIGLTLSSTLLLTACGTKEATPTLPEETPTTTSDLLSGTTTTMHCPEAVQNYLNQATFEPKSDAPSVQANTTIVVDYIGRLADGTVFDTSIESVAKACGVYVAERNYNEGLSFVVGEGKMIQGFDNAVLGMQAGQTKTVNIPPAEAYGEWSEEYVQTYPISDVPNPDDYQEGMKLSVGYGMTATITKKTDKDITLDLNHELAGKELIFDITVKTIN
ncbi:MAG: peptidylprolyl isomerase [Candidatus Peribacteria bacterium]|jgi:FKBP-type peptidyl-prolyl cis-trans isomerase SlyD|nr:peptidylprolyl isomerase [Candidatus Peribacteria bacterium]